MCRWPTVLALDPVFKGPLLLCELWLLAIKVDSCERNIDLWLLIRRSNGVTSPQAADLDCALKASAEDTIYCSRHVDELEVKSKFNLQRGALEWCTVYAAYTDAEPWKPNKILCQMFLIWACWGILLYIKPWTNVYMITVITPHKVTLSFKYHTYSMLWGHS